MSKTFTLRKPACNVGPYLKSGNVDFERSPNILRTIKSGSLCINCFMLNTALLGVLNFGMF